MVLGPAQETLLIPLYGRAELTRQGSPLISDPKAVEMVEAIDYDFARWDGTPSLFGSVVRTRIHDHWVSTWMAAHPDGTVVEVGAGLNTRFERLDDGRVHWIDLDLPDAMDLRRRFFAESDRRTLLAASIVDDGWVAAVAASPGPWCFVAEAVLIYLPEEQVRTAFALMGRFADARVSFDTWGSWMLEHQDDHDTLGAMEARVQWCCDDPRTVEAWAPGWTLVESCTFPDAPAEVLALAPPPVLELLPALREDPQVNAYRQNVVERVPS